MAGKSSLLVSPTKTTASSSKRSTGPKRPWYQVAHPTEETKEALAEIDHMRSWGDLVNACKKQECKRKRKRKRC